MKNNFESKGSLTHGRKLINVVDKPIMIHAEKMDGSLGLVDVSQKYVLIGHIKEFMIRNCCAKGFFSKINIHEGNYI